MAIQQDTDFVPEVDEFSIENTESSLDARPAGATASIASGWGAAEAAIKPKEYANNFKPTEKAQLIKFLDQSGPFAVYNEHWLDAKTEGQRSYVCAGQGCPLCLKLNDKPKKKYGFSVAVISPTETTLARFIATPLYFKALHAAEHSPSGPLTKNYWSVFRHGSMKDTILTLNPVKSRDLLEDYGIDEAKVEADIAGMTLFDASAVYTLSIADLDEVANALI
jgi:hypothetical protein